MTSGKEGRPVRLRRIAYSMVSLIALVAAISAGWKN
jgi:hypothetical protein